MCNSQSIVGAPGASPILSLSLKEGNQKNNKIWTIAPELSAFFAWQSQGNRSGTGDEMATQQAWLLTVAQLAPAGHGGMGDLWWVLGRKLQLPDQYGAANFIQPRAQRLAKCMRTLQIANARRRIRL